MSEHGHIQLSLKGPPRWFFKPKTNVVQGVEISKKVFYWIAPKSPTK